MARYSTTQKVLGVTLSAIALASFMLWRSYKQHEARRKRLSSPSTPSGKGVSADGETPQVSNKSQDEKAIHLKIEALDKKGKKLFKENEYMEAADCFTEALELIEAVGPGRSQSLARQYITLVNNRSAMYEKAEMNDLALEDCATILKEDTGHIKARMRRMRILESEEEWEDALVEMCALELKFMQDNRDKLRMGIPVSPPVPHSKLEELLQKVIPEAVHAQLETNKTKTDERPLPSKHTILQLLQSFSGYHSWMAAAAKEGSADKLTKDLEDEKEPTARASLLCKRGRRHAYDRDFEGCRNDFEEAFALVGHASADSMPDDEMARLLEWTGMVRHWSYHLDAASKCYERCSDLEPLNVRIKQCSDSLVFVNPLLIRIVMLSRQVCW